MGIEEKIISDLVSLNNKYFSEQEAKIQSEIRASSEKIKQLEVRAKSRKFKLNINGLARLLNIFRDLSLIEIEKEKMRLNDFNEKLIKVEKEKEKNIDFICGIFDFSNTNKRIMVDLSGRLYDQTSSRLYNSKVKRETLKLFLKLFPEEAIRDNSQISYKTLISVVGTKYRESTIERICDNIFFRQKQINN